MNPIATAEIISGNGRSHVQLRMEGIERQLPTGRPLAKLDTVMHVLDRDEDSVKYLYESGILQFAFNLASANSKRAEVRIHRESIVAYAQADLTHLQKRNEGRDDATQLTRVIRGCLPPGNKPILLSKLKRLWSVSSTHLHDLCAAKEFALVPGQQLRAKESPLLDRPSVMTFLQRRRIV